MDFKINWLNIKKVFYPDGFKRFWPVVGIILLIATLHFNVYNMPLERNEGEYAYSAKLLLNGDLPYRDSFMIKPPMVIYTYALGQLVFGDGVWVPRLLLSLVIFGLALLCRYIAKKEYGEDAGTAAMYLSVLLLSIPHLMTTSAETEMLMLLPLLGAVAIYVKNRELNSLSSFWPSFWAGFLATTSVLYKPFSLIAVIFLFAVWIWQVWFKEKNIFTTTKTTIHIVAGALASLTLCLGYFIFKDGGKSLWEVAVVYPFYYSKWMNTFPTALPTLLEVFWKTSTYLYLFFIIYLLQKSKNWWFYLGLLLCSLVLVINATVGRYYITILPFLAIICASGLKTLSVYLSKKTKNKYIFGMLLVLMLLFTIGSTDERFAKIPNEMSEWVYSTGNPFVESRIVAEKLASITTPDDYVFVAGSEPQILYYANRKSSSRFVITYPLVLKTPLWEKYQRETINDLMKNPPQAIVLSLLDNSGLTRGDEPPYFINFLENLLKEEYQIAGGYVRNSFKRSTEGIWKDVLSEEDLQNASLVLYKRI